MACQLCHGLAAAPETRGAANDVVATNFKELTESQAKGCRFCRLLWEILASQEVPSVGIPPKDVHVSLSKLYTGDVVLSAYWADGGSYYDPQVIMLLYLDKEDPSHPMNGLLNTRNHIIQDPSSEPATKLVSQWLTDCNDPTKHALCRPNHAAVPLPTRVIDVGAPPAGTTTTAAAAAAAPVKLVETRNRPGTYIALSHCWGAHQIITTTRATLAARQAGIPLAALSQTFRDAVAWTRRLRVRYLWIDSLCIVQDSPADWEAESTRMGAIYANAYATLAATAAAGGDVGFAVRRAHPPQEFRLGDGDDGGGGGDGGPGPRRRGRHAVWAQRQPPHDGFTRRRHADPRAMPLLARAWVHQERVQSARVVHFGAHELVLECANGCACECGGAARFSAGMASQNVGFKQEYGDVLDGRAGAADPVQRRYMWDALVRGYTACALTFEQDRLPALSATARRLEARLGRYFAGLWESMLPGALFWRADAWEFANPAGSLVRKGGLWTPARRSSAPRRPPSWSWASVEGAVVDAVHPVTVSEVRILETSTKPLLSDPYGSIPEGHIRLVGPLVRVDARVVLTDSAAGKHLHYQLHREGLVHDFLQDVEISDEDATQISENGLHCLVGGYHNKTCLVLVLKPSKSEPGTYQREGFTRDIPEQWVSAAKELTITII